MLPDASAYFQAFAEVLLVAAILHPPLCNKLSCFAPFKGCSHGTFGELLVWYLQMVLV
ncbi:unnamed protein product [Brugia pahangi]|uniref:Secreted protein n=1 Tax=Brugia pahangi TaxID=6280 RepID=A0A0N4T4K4_BRUPA|nr:unnamed protein product [Brugia pahangi]